MTKPLGQTKYSVQNMGNASFDEDFGVNTVEIVGFDGSVLRRISLNESGNITTSDETVLLRRIVKLLESQATVDVRNRQIVTIGALKTSDASSTPTEIAATIPVTATVASVTSVIGNPNNAAPPYTSSATLYQPIFEGPVDQRYRVAEDSHISYQLGIRSHLSFT